MWVPTVRDGPPPRPRSTHGGAFDERVHDGIFCFGLIYLLDPPGAKLIRDCVAQLAPGGWMVFTAVSKQAPMYGRGVELGDDWFETQPGMRLFFYDGSSIERACGGHGLIEVAEIREAAASGAELPLHFVACRRLPEAPAPR